MYTGKVVDPFSGHYTSCLQVAPTTLRVLLNIKSCSFQNNLSTSSIDQLSINQLQNNLIQSGQRFIQQQQHHHQFHHHHHLPAMEANPPPPSVPNPQTNQSRMQEVKQEFAQPDFQLATNSSAISTINTIEQPTTSKLCAVCNDRASGKHYGVFSCEGCKVGFLMKLIHPRVISKKISNQSYCVFSSLVF